jgi:N-dimethylarginine dimethylaminohydrolase
VSVFAARFDSPAERFRALTVATLGSTPRFLMCPPQHFAVTYSINPWMDPAKWADDGAALQARAAQQWMALHAALLEAGAMIETVPPLKGAPDLVFTANAAVVLDGKALFARFRHPERQIEEPVFAAGFRALAERGLIDEVIELPRGIALEGAGDCLWDRKRGVFWMGCGFRSDEAAAREVEAAFGVPCIPLKLSEASYYHLDTAMCALPCGGVIYYPHAFTPVALETIHAHVAPADRIPLTPEDAAHFAANAVVVGRNIVLSSCSPELRRTLEARGYRVVETLLDAFQRSGGSACCLTLRLDHRSQTAQQAQRRAS